MATQGKRVTFAEPALSDLEEFAEFWTGREEPERGQKYAFDLYEAAVRELSCLATAQAGRHLRRSKYPRGQKILVFSRSYRILYECHEAEAWVEVLRFWHSHRDEPFGD